MLLPIKTDCPPKKPPIVNYLLIFINVVIFIVLNYYLPKPTRLSLYNQFMLNCNDPRLYQFITYAFLHADWSHLLGNMLFLYIFGNSLNDKLGHIEYLLFYIISAIVSGGSYAIYSSASLLGASGAIAAITTAFLVFFPRSNVLIIYWFYLIGTFEIPSIYLILFKMVLFDNIIIPLLSRSNEPIAYGAHLVGYGFGLVAPFLLLITNSIERDQFDSLALIDRFLRRRRFKKLTDKTGGVFYKDLIKEETDNKAKTRVKKEPFGFKTVKVKDLASDKDTQSEVIAAQLKKRITDALKIFDYKAAFEGYKELIRKYPDEVLSEKNQLDIANQLMAEADYPLAADAYERFIRNYPQSEYAEQAKLLLGTLYSRYLNNPKRAIELFQQIVNNLRDPQQKALCQSELKKLLKDIPDS